jgi:hypothetical protein
MRASVNGRVKNSADVYSRFAHGSAFAQRIPEGYLPQEELTCPSCSPTPKKEKENAGWQTQSQPGESSRQEWERAHRLLSSKLPDELSIALSDSEDSHGQTPSEGPSIRDLPRLEFPWPKPMKCCGNH